MQDGILKKGFMGLTGALDRRFGWDHLPKPLALMTIVGLRMTLRRHNLFDTSGTYRRMGARTAPAGAPFAGAVDGWDGHRPPPP